MTVNKLPENYVEIKKIDLQKNKKLAVLINIGALIVAGVMASIALLFIPFTMYDYRDNSSNELLEILLKPSLLLLVMFAYLIFHEVIHGIFMKIFSGIKPRLGFTGLYGYAASDAYFNKKNYLVISLAPIIILGFILFILNLILPIGWFWFIYMLQIFNVSGASGDIYVAWLIRKMPDDVLTLDTGVSMTIYSKS